VAEPRELITPSACAWCDHPEYNHASRWSSALYESTGVGYHSYVAPSQALIKRRMQARRERSRLRMLAIREARLARQIGEAP
jgi:hypothetical protein